MKRKIRKIFLALLVLGSLTISTGLAQARHEWRWSYEDRWDHRDELRRQYRDLEEARRQLDYDLRRGASRRRIAEDRARIREIEESIRDHQYALNRWYR